MFAGSLYSPPPPVIASMILFDVFYHQFFHHLVEHAATSVEVLWPAPSCSTTSPRDESYHRHGLLE
jgi:hypothetical protein